MAGTGALLFTLGVDAVIFIVSLVLFALVRDARGDRVKGAPLTGGPGLCEADDCLASLWSVPISSIGNVEVKLYLRFLEGLATFFAVVTLLGLLAALPVNLGGTKFQFGLERACLENVLPGDPRLWIVFGCSLGVAALGYLALAVYRRDAKAEKQQRGPCAVVVSNLDRRSTDDKPIRAYFEQRFPGSVQDVHLVEDDRDLQHATRQLRAAEARLDAEDEWRQLLGFDLSCWAYRAEDEVQYRQLVLKRVAARGASASTGVAFVVFRHASCVEQAVLLRDYGWKVERAPPPTDVHWTNLGARSGAERAYSLCWTLGLLALTLAVLSPVAVMAKLNPLVDSFGKAALGDSYLRTMLLCYWPPLIVFLVNSLLTPFCISFVAARQKHWRKSSTQLTVLTLNSVFLVLNTFLVPLLSLGGIDTFLERMLEIPLGQWNTELGSVVLSSSGGFAVQYMASALFLSNGVQLVQPRCLLTSWDPPEFDFGYWYASALSIATLCLGFSLVVPLILPLASLYFFVKLYVDKYNFLFHVCPVAIDSGGRLAHAVLPHCFLGLALFEFLMSGFFVVQGGTLSLAGAALGLLSALTVALAVLETPAVLRPLPVASSSDARYRPPALP